MNCQAIATLTALIPGGAASAAEGTTIKAYVDTDVCSHLPPGSVTTERTECRAKAFKPAAK